MKSSVWAIVVAAGSGTRFGGPKQLELLGEGGRRVIDWSLDAVRSTCDGVVLVVSTELEDQFADIDADSRVIGGKTRSESVRAGLGAVPDSAQVIVVHDAARPMATSDLTNQVIEAVRSGAQCAIPGVAVVDTIKRVDRSDMSTVIETVDRSELVAVQTPQAFDAEWLRRAHKGEPEASDDAALIEMIGGRVVIVPGEASNQKITSRKDLEIARLGWAPR
jgi:2-C-methyl-D-erythritol 4-phosphate cytidylyltransferase